MSLGPLELAVLVFIGLLFFGPKKLPELGRAFGDTIRGFKKAMNENDAKPPAPTARQAPPEATPTAEAKQTEKEKERV